MMMVMIKKEKETELEEELRSVQSRNQTVIEQTEHINRVVPTYQTESVREKPRPGFNFKSNTKQPQT